MNNSKLILLALTLLLCLTAKQAAAKGGGMDGGGGDSRCAEFANIAGKISVTLVRLGQERINKVSPVVDVRSFWEAKKQMRCIPVSSLDRVARSYRSGARGSVYTELLVSEWEKLSFISKARLAAHELAVLAGYENDGEYFISAPIFNEIAKESEDFKYPLMGQVINNRDDSVTFINPAVPYYSKEAQPSNNTAENLRFILANSQSHADGACKFAGFRAAASQNGINHRAYFSSSQHPVEFSGAGHLRGPITDNRSYYSVFTALTCLN